MKGPGTPRGTPVVVRFPLERLAVTLAGCALAAPLLIVALRALGLPLPAAGVAVAGGLIAAAPRVVRWLPPGLDGAARWRPVLAVLWLIGGAGGGVPDGAPVHLHARPAGPRAFLVPRQRLLHAALVRQRLRRGGPAGARA